MHIPGNARWGQREGVDAFEEQGMGEAMFPASCACSDNQLGSESLLGSHSCAQLTRNTGRGSGNLSSQFCLEQFLLEVAEGNLR